MRVFLLLFNEVGLRNIDHGGSVNIDVVKASGNGFSNEFPDGIQLDFRIVLIFCAVDLKMVALDEDRPAEAFFYRGGHNASNIFRRALVCITDFGASDFKD